MVLGHLHACNVKYFFRFEISKVMFQYTHQNSLCPVKGCIRVKHTRVNCDINLEI